MSLTIGPIANRDPAPKRFSIGSSLKERVRPISVKMPELLQGPERVAVRIADVSRFVFLSVCWGVFVYYALHTMTPAAVFPSMARLVATLHMMIQSV